MSGVSFDRIADRYEETRGGIERGQRFAATMASHLPASAAILEVGVGTGAIAAPLTDLGHHVVGVDLSRAMLRQAAKRLPGRVVEGDATRLPFRDTSFDAVVAVWAVHLVVDVPALAREVVRVLRPEGALLVVASSPDVEPNDVSLAATLLNQNLRLGHDRSPLLAPVLAEVGLRWQGDEPTDVHHFAESPAERIASIEARTWSSLWDLDDETWASKVEPVLAELRALPDPDRPRPCVHRHVLSVYRWPG